MKYILKGLFSLHHIECCIYNWYFFLIIMHIQCITSLRYMHYIPTSTDTKKAPSFGPISCLLKHSSRKTKFLLRKKQILIFFCEKKSRKMCFYQWVYLPDEEIQFEMEILFDIYRFNRLYCLHNKFHLDRFFQIPLVVFLNYNCIRIQDQKHWKHQSLLSQEWIEYWFNNEH